MAKMKAYLAKSGFAFIVALITSTVWFLALADGTVDVVKKSYDRKLEIEVLSSTKEKLQLETEIYELEIKKRVYIAQLKYMESQGF